MVNLLEGQNLTKTFPVRGGVLGRVVGRIVAVDSVNVVLRVGVTLGLVGESGSGKTTVGRLLLRIEEPDEGRILFQGVPLRTLRGPRLTEYRRSVQAVFQDPATAFNPRMRVRDIVLEPLRASGLSATAARVRELLNDVSLSEAIAARFPHELSGGQRQRVAIARAVSTGPAVIVLDEPVSALDVSVRAQVLNALRAVQKSHSLGYLLIAHDLPTVRYMSDRIAVMYLGRIVEEGPASAVCDEPLHPYTQSLVASVLDARASTARGRRPPEGEIPSATNVPSGCSFRTRCPAAQPQCKELEPPLIQVDASRWAACHFVGPSPGRVTHFLPEESSRGTAFGDP